MLNLVQISEKLKDMPMQAVAAYANGSNPMVPPYVALGELNRRKQMEQSAAAEQTKDAANQPTVKDQMEQQLGLMSLQQERQAQGAQQMGQAMANNPNIPTQAPVQMAKGGRVPTELFQRGMRPRGEVSRGVPEERGISGNDLKKMMMMSAMKKQRDGIANLPMKREMLSKRNFAGGGIVAFQAGGETDQEMQNFDQAAALYEAERAARAPQQEAPVDAKDLLRSLIQKAGKEKTLEEMVAEQKRARQLTGVSDDPYAESRKSRDEITASRRAYDKDQPSRRMQETLLGIASAKPGQGLGMALGEGARADLKEQERFRALNDQQRMEEMKLVKADEKEKDAYARGDAAAILKAQQEKDVLNVKIAELSTETDRFAFDKFNSAVNSNSSIRSLEEQRKYDNPKPGSPEYRWYDDAINKIRRQLAIENGYKGPIATIDSPPVVPKKEEEKKGPFGGKKDDKKAGPAQKVDTGIPPGLPPGTKYFDRTPDGKAIYLLPSGKKIIQQ